MLKASSFTQDELLIVKNKETIDTPVMVTTYNPINPLNPDIKGFIHDNWNIIEHSNDCSKTFKDYKRLPNLRNLLTKAKIAYSPTTQDKPIIKPTICTRLSKCTYCSLTKKVSEVQCKVANKITKITKVHKHTTCELSDIIYLIT